MGVGHQVYVCPINHKVLDIILQTDWWFHIDFCLVYNPECYMYVLYALPSIDTHCSALYCYMYDVPWIVMYLHFLG